MPWKSFFLFVHFSFCNWCDVDDNDDGGGGGSSNNNNNNSMGKFCARLWSTEKKNEMNKSEWALDLIFLIACVFCWCAYDGAEIAAGAAVIGVD